VIEKAKTSKITAKSTDWPDQPISPIAEQHSIASGSVYTPTNDDVAESSPEQTAADGGADDSMEEDSDEPPLGTWDATPASKTHALDMPEDTPPRTNPHRSTQKRSIEVLVTTPRPSAERGSLQNSHRKELHPITVSETRRQLTSNGAAHNSPVRVVTATSPSQMTPTETGIPFEFPIESSGGSDVPIPVSLAQKQGSSRPPNNEPSTDTKKDVSPSVAPTEIHNKVKKSRRSMPWGQRESALPGALRPAVTNEEQPRVVETLADVAKKARASYPNKPPASSGLWQGMTRLFNSFPAQPVASKSRQSSSPRENKSRKKNTQEPTRLTSPKAPPSTNRLPSAAQANDLVPETPLAVHQPVQRIPPFTEDDDEDSLFVPSTNPTRPEATTPSLASQEALVEPTPLPRFENLEVRKRKGGPLDPEPPSLKRAKTAEIVFNMTQDAPVSQDPAQRAFEQRQSFINQAMRTSFTPTSEIVQTTELPTALPANRPVTSNHNTSRLASPASSFANRQSIKISTSQSPLARPEPHVPDKPPGPTFEEVFDEFRSAYPDYSGSKGHFKAICVILADDQYTFFESMYDDLIIRYVDEYVHEYIPKASETGLFTSGGFLSYPLWAKKNIKGWMYTKGIMTEEKVRAGLANLEALDSEMKLE
jgi:hypothetical protein